MTFSPFRLMRASFIGALVFNSLFWAHSAFAVGLGELRSDTRLGYPLRAEIPIHTGSDVLTADELKATLMNEQEAASHGVELLSSRYGFEVAIEEQGKQLLLVISTVTPVKEPVLHWVIRLEWPQGSLAREYTLMLDL